MDPFRSEPRKGSLSLSEAELFALVFGALWIVRLSLLLDGDDHPESARLGRTGEAGDGGVLCMIG